MRRTHAGLLCCILSPAAPMSLLPNPAKSTAPLLPPTAHLLVPLPPNHEGLVSARCTSFAWQQTSKRVHWWLIDPFLGSARNLTPPLSVARAAPACASWSPPVRWHAPLDSADIRLEGPSQRASVDIRLEGPSQRDRAGGTPALMSSRSK